mmetsp:Transcript_6598/g.19131  ORF Transcript_6598/g.19131 Transcript_6598/m.19131 type:complete len:200 (-) Transcript_6598:646-1245(-)
MALSMVRSYHAFTHACLNAFSMKAIIFMLALYRSPSDSSLPARPSCSTANASAKYSMLGRPVYMSLSASMGHSATKAAASSRTGSVMPRKGFRYRRGAPGLSSSSSFSCSCSCSCASGRNRHASRGSCRLTASLMMSSARSAGNPLAMRLRYQSAVSSSSWSSSLSYAASSVSFISKVRSALQSKWNGQSLISAFSRSS